MMAFSFGQGLALPNLIAHGIRLAPNYTGVASSMFGFSQLALSAIAVQIMGYVPAQRLAAGAVVLRHRRGDVRSSASSASKRRQISPTQRIGKPPPCRVNCARQC